MQNEWGQPIGEPVQWTPLPGATPVTLRGRTVVLEPLSPAHADDLTRSLAEPSLWTYIPTGPYPDGADYVADMLAAPLVPFAVVVDGVAHGVECLMRDDPANGVIEVGGIVLGPALHRTVAATEAAYLLARHVFDDLGYRRYEWKCDSLNQPSRRAAVRFGFSYEGRFRNALVYKGRNRDTDWFAMTRSDWPEVRERFETWLDPANFDQQGRQLRPLRPESDQYPGSASNI